jgi:uncharacterized circularly permuted ATP-grasp superfamily protein/uncharacterized alpha-E superfamily protein
MTLAPTVGLLAGYLPADGAFDEMVDHGGLRDHWERIAASVDRLGPGVLEDRRREARRLLTEDGVTYNQTTGDRTVARPWTLDLLPVVLRDAEWTSIEAGLAQRAELLDLVLADVYGECRIVDEGLVPPEVIHGHPGFLRECHEIRLPSERQLFQAAFDLGRTAEGDWTVLADRTQAPSGAAYALENRVVTARVLPELYRRSEVVRLAPFFRSMRAALHRVAPRTDDGPRIVVLTPGPWSETAYEHGALATHLGLPLVQGSDLRVRDGRVWLRTPGRLEPVHVIVRRVDAAFGDPLELRPDSTLGAPGLLDACRVGNVSVVNTFGSGVLENPGLAPYLPQLARALLGSDLLLPSVESWWCGDPLARRHALGRLDRLVFKSVAPTPVTVLGWEIGPAQRAELAAAIAARPHAWTAQAPVPLSSTPTFAEGRLAPRKTVLRGFAVAGTDGYVVMPGGLTRVAPDDATEHISNQHGAWSKDTWVLAGKPEPIAGYWLQPVSSPTPSDPPPPLSQRAAENLFWLGRYAERAESLVRLLRVTSDRLNELSTATNPAGHATVAVLLEALARSSGSANEASETAPATLAGGAVAEVRALLVDGSRTGSVAYAVRRVLDAAAQVRDQLSSDTWLVIGHLDHDLANLDDGPMASDAGGLGRVVAAMLALAGLSAESMVRDDGWQFMEAGRRLERALQITALLAATTTIRRDDATDGMVLESTLVAAESIITYRRRHRSQARVATLLDLLLCDGANPRSLAFQVERLSSVIEAMPTAEPAHQTDLEALVRQLAAQVEGIDTAELARTQGPSTSGQPGRPVLVGQLDAITGILTSLGEAIDRAHFSHQLPQRPVAPMRPSRRLGRIAPEARR